MYAALAEVADRDGFVRPELHDGDEICIDGGRHPVVEAALGPERFIANDCALGGDDALRRHFVEALRRAEIVSLLNASANEDELGRTFAEELCEVFDAEIAFIAEGDSPTGPPRMISSVGLAPAGGNLLDDPLMGEAIAATRASNLIDPDLQALQAREERGP